MLWGKVWGAFWFSMIIDFGGLQWGPLEFFDHNMGKTYPDWQGHCHVGVCLDPLIPRKGIFNATLNKKHPAQLYDLTFWQSFGENSHLGGIVRCPQTWLYSVFICNCWYKKWNKDMTLIFPSQDNMFNCAVFPVSPPLCPPSPCIQQG